MSVPVTQLPEGKLRLPIMVPPSQGEMNLLMAGINCAPFEETFARLKQEGREICANGVAANCQYCKGKEERCPIDPVEYKRLAFLDAASIFEPAHRYYKDQTSYGLKHIIQHAATTQGVNGYSCNGAFIVYMASRGFAFRIEGDSLNVLFKIKSPWA